MEILLVVATFGALLAFVLVRRPLPGRTALLAALVPPAGFGLTSMFC